MTNLNRNNRINRKDRNASILVIYTEGDVTEPEYIKSWIKSYCDENELNYLKKKTRVRVERSKGRTEPLKIVERLIEKEAPKANNPDVYFIVFDEDDRSSGGGKIKQNLDEAFQKINDCEQITLIYSNKSVELWALQHFTDKAPLTKKQLKESLVAYMPTYSDENKRFDIAKMRKDNNETLAIARAKKLRETHIKQGRDWKETPSTNLDELISAIEDIIDRP